MKDTVGAAAQGTNEKLEAETLERRVLDRWHALIRRDFEQAYMFETPAFRSIYDLKYYKKQFGDRVGWVDAEVQSVQHEGQIAQVIVSVRYKALLPFAGVDGRKVVENATFLKEKWIQEGGLWFHMKK